MTCTTSTRSPATAVRWRPPTTPRWRGFATPGRTSSPTRASRSCDDPGRETPVSHGAFELTVGVVPNVPAPDEVLDSIAAAGYEGTELGPRGYLRAGGHLRDRLE